MHQGRLSLSSVEKPPVGTRRLFGHSQGCYLVRMITPSAERCRQIIPVLRARDGKETGVLLSNERALTVYNIAWGDDLGDDFEHVTTNASPKVDGATIDLFFTDEVASIIDPLSGILLWETDGTPNVR